MKETIDCILLVDDDSATNFIHQTLLQQIALPGQIVAVENGLEALEYLHTKQEGRFSKPDLILLDINMPVMNGWEFLEKYSNLSTSQRADKLILMLTATLSPAEMARAEANPHISGFMKKPLNMALVNDLLSKYFG